MIAITNGVLRLIYTMILIYINARSMTCNGIMTLCKHRLTQGSRACYKKNSHGASSQPLME